MKMDKVEKNILLISDGGGFMIDALANNLKKIADFGVVKVSPSVDEIMNGSNSCDIFLLYLGEYVHEATDVLTYLKDICGENKKFLCVIGYDKEIEAATKVIPSTMITRIFPRPFDMRKLAEEIDGVTSVNNVTIPEKAKHILLVDDDGAFLKMMQTWLSPMYHVTIVNSGMQAITYIANNTPDLILLDYDMPITPGPQVLEMIRSEPASAKIPVIFLTGKADRESVTNVMRLKPEGYLLKTMKKQDIVDSVNHFFITKEWKSIQ